MWWFGRPSKTSREKQPVATPSDTESEHNKGDRVELQEDDAYEVLGYSFPWWKKWMILTVIFIVQCSMNYNASVFSSAAGQLEEHFGVGAAATRVAEALFLIFYAFGCELWAPWSEELGRWPILQGSLFLVNIWQILCGLAPNWGSIVVGRALGGLSSAGGSVTLAIVADMWEPADQQFAVAYVVFSSVGGSVLGPIFGAFPARYLTWRWNFWTQLIFGGFTQALHLLLVPETRSTLLLDKEAKRLRKTGENPNAYGPNEIRGSFWQRIDAKEITAIWIRPFRMFLTEPIVLCLSLLSGFSDALIYIFLDAYTPVYSQWNFGTIALGMTYIPILVGYIIGYVSFIPFFFRDRKYMHAHGGEMPPERRLKWLLFLAPLETIGLFGFAWTSLGPQYGIPWIAPMIFSALVGIANYAIYMATIDYMIAAYGPYSASATGGNGFARDFLAGIAAFYATPFYNYFKTNTLEWPSTILACIALICTLPIFVFYWFGPQVRARSKFAQTLAGEREGRDGRRASRATASALQHTEDEAAARKRRGQEANNALQQERAGEQS